MEELFGLVIEERWEMKFQQWKMELGHFREKEWLVKDPEMRIWGMMGTLNGAE